jgi:hypothetical protein
MRQQCRRGKPFNWNKVDEAAHDTITHRGNEAAKIIKLSPPSPPASPRLFSDQCPFCFFDDGFPPADRMRRYTRIDSLRPSESGVTPQPRVFISTILRYGHRGRTDHAVRNLSVMGSPCRALYRGRPALKMATLASSTRTTT